VQHIGQDEDQTAGGFDRDCDDRYRPASEGGFGITAELDVYLPELPEAEAKSLVKATHEICP
jgi:organic hydroperoxide reductase OsmC/OhrA